jgi:hypothetical protein
VRDQAQGASVFARDVIDNVKDRLRRHNVRFPPFHLLGIASMFRGGCWQPTRWWSVVARRAALVVDALGGGREQKRRRLLTAKGCSCSRLPQDEITTTNAGCKFVTTKSVRSSTASFSW